MSLPGEAAPEEALCRPPREAWPLARVLNALLMKMGRIGLLALPRRGLQAGKSGDPRSQNADSLEGATREGVLKPMWIFTEDGPYWAASGATPWAAGRLVWGPPFPERRH